MDLAGPMRTQSIQGSFYHYVIVDDYMRYKWVFFLRTKDQAFEKFQIFLMFITTQFNATLKAARSDRGGGNSSQGSSQNSWKVKGLNTNLLPLTRHSKRGSQKGPTIPSLALPEHCYRWPECQMASGNVLYLQLHM
jgi:hypothetical protein